MNVLDGYERQTCLFDSTAAELGPLAECQRTQLDDCCWIEYLPNWVGGGEQLMAELVDQLSWATHRRPMYDRIVDVPRLTASLPLDDPQLPPLLGDAARALSAHYDVDFDSAGFNLYRDGEDSVAWHGDRIGRRRRRAVVALVSLGAPRPFRLRPAGGGPSRRFDLGRGDLLVMGGSCQRDWQHCVPKVAHAEPRLSIALRCLPEPDRH